MDFRILGPVEAWDRGRQLAIPGERQRALLAILLLNANRVLSAEQLVDELWGEEPPATGTKAVQVAVSQLRRSFEAEGMTHPVVFTRPPGYVIELGGDQLDLHRFERLVAGADRAVERGDPETAGQRLRDALALWRGPPLAEFAAPFAGPATAWLEEMRLAALERRVEADLALGRHGDLIGELEQLIAANPFRERLRGQLMLSLYRSGRQGEALAAHRETRRLLVDELGIEPSQSIQQLEAAILRQDPGLELDHARGPAAPHAPTVELSPAVRSVLVVPQDLAGLPDLLAVAQPLTQRPRREIIVAAVVSAEADVEAVTAQLEEARRAVDATGTPIRIAAFTSVDRGADLVRLASEQEADLVVVDAPAALLAEGAPPADLDTLWREAPCDVAVLAAGAEGARSLTGERPVIVPFGGGEHEWGALEIGAWIAAAHDAPLQLLGSAPRPQRGKRDASRLLAGVSLIVQRAAGIAATPLIVEPGEASVLAATEGAGLVVIGLSERWAHEGLAGTRLALARSGRGPALLVRRGWRPGGLAPIEPLSRYTWSVADAG